MNQKAVERHDGCVLNDVIFWKGFVLNDDQFCVKQKIVAINQTEFQRDEKVRQQAIIREPNSTEVLKQTYNIF